MPTVELKGITNYICRGVNLAIENGELLVLLGRTGAGKTTLLNVIAGLAPYKGSVTFDGVEVDSLPARKRKVGYLFQDFCLFPHLNVRENIAFGLRAKGLSKSDVFRRVDELLSSFKLQHLADRYPNKGLSGGEKQRVALARALAPWPEVLLLDEPFNSLDLRTAKHLRMELKRIQRSFHITTVYVTHNQREVSEMGDRIAVIHKGRVEQIGTYGEVFFAPKSKSVSSLLGSPNIFHCKSFTPLTSGIAQVKLNGISLVVPYDGCPIEKVAISPWNIYVSRQKPPGPEINRLRGIILSVRRTSPIVNVKVKCGNETLNIELQEEQWDDLELQAGNMVFVILPLRWIEVKRGE